jgi:hypothetical protein
MSTRRCRFAFLLWLALRFSVVWQCRNPHQTRSLLAMPRHGRDGKKLLFYGLRPSSEGGKEVANRLRRWQMLGEMTPGRFGEQLRSKLLAGRGD